MPLLEKSISYTLRRNILSTDEKTGGAPKPASQMSAFSGVLHDCGLLEILFEGPMHTWRRGRGQDMVLECLDRGVANSAWLDCFSFSKERHMISDISYHLPILLEVKTCKGF